MVPSDLKIMILLLVETYEKNAVRNSFTLSNEIKWVSNSEINMRKKRIKAWGFDPIRSNIETVSLNRDCGDSQLCHWHVQRQLLI